MIDMIKIRKKRECKLFNKSKNLLNSEIKIIKVVEYHMLIKLNANFNNNNNNK